MASISIGDAQLIVHWGVEIYRKIHGADGEIRQVGIMLEELDGYLDFLRRLVETKSATAGQSDQHWNELTARITDRMGQVKKVTRGVNSILQIYYENGSLSKYLFPFGRNPKTLRNLIEDLQRHETALDRELLSANLMPAQPAAGGVRLPVARPLPSPSPKPTKEDYTLIYVDPHNQGRSKVAEGYTKLLREWTVLTGGSWAVRFAHSAGLRVRARSDCVEVLQNLKPSFTMSAGASSPSPAALASLFDNKFFNYDYKPGIIAGMEKSVSRGINTNIFQTYDYILVFTQREFTRLLALKKALIATHGAKIATKDRGRIVHLGAYISKDGNPQPIADAKKGEDGREKREEWNKTTSQIKLAVKGFLKDELDWKQPPSQWT